MRSPTKHDFKTMAGTNSWIKVILQKGGRTNIWIAYLTWEIHAKYLFHNFHIFNLNKHIKTRMIKTPKYSARFIVKGVRRRYY